MVECCAFLKILIDATEHADLDCSVGEADAHETPFQFTETLLVTGCLLPLLRPLASVFEFHCLAVCLVVSLAEIVGAYVVCIVGVLAESGQQSDIVSPNGYICDAVAVAQSDAVR